MIALYDREDGGVIAAELLELRSMRPDLEGAFRLAAQDHPRWSTWFRDGCPFLVWLELPRESVPGLAHWTEGRLDVPEWWPDWLGSAQVSSHEARLRVLAEVLADRVRERVIQDPVSWLRTGHVILTQTDKAEGAIALVGWETVRTVGRAEN